MKFSKIIKAVLNVLKNKWVQRAYLTAMFVFLGIVFYKYKGEISVRNRKSGGTTWCSRSTHSGG